jgi:FdhE protein
MMADTAAKRAYLRKNIQEHPEYGDILPLFEGLFEMVEGREENTGIRFTSSPEHQRERIESGFPLLVAEDLQVESRPAVAFLASVIDVMLAYGKEGIAELNHLRQLVLAEGLDLRLLYGSCLSRDRRVLEEAAAKFQVPASLMEFVLEVPLKTALEFFAEKVLPEHIDGWSEGYCPVCGSRAGMGEIAGEEGKRLLSCSSCFFKWPYKRLKCPYCSNEEPESLSYFTAGEGPTRVDVCRKCSRYIKTRDTRLGNADVPLEAEDLATIHLDLLAGKEGFERGK